MSLNLSDKQWLKPVLITTIAIAAIVLWAYLAGGIFLMAFDRSFDDATPLTLYQYWKHYGHEKKVADWLFYASGISLLILFSPALIFARAKKRSLFGEARFAKEGEIKKAGLLEENGIIVGKHKGKYLMFPGAQHAMISAPTRSGKGVGIVIPNLLNWPESVVVLDIKQENWDITSGYRARYGQECFLFNPAAVDYRTHRYNPLAYISADPNFRFDDISKIANMLIPDQPGTDTIWTATPRSLFSGIVQYLIETPGKPVTLGQVLRETYGGSNPTQYFAKLIRDREASGNPLSESCQRGLNSYATIESENTRSGIMTTFRSRLEQWENKLVDAATSENDFDLRDIRKKRMSIYIGVTPDNLERMQPIINLFFQQLIDLNTRELPEQNKELKYTCLLLMDEFTAAGKLPTLSKGISYIAGYKLRMMPIIQSPAQLVSVYGKEDAQTFMTNHALQIIFPPKASETQTARDISEWLGYTTVKGKSESESKGFFSKQSKSESTSDQKRALLLPQEITSLGQKRELVIAENTPPILASKVVYYQDSVFTDRLNEVSHDPTKRGAPVPTLNLPGSPSFSSSANTKTEGSAENVMTAEKTVTVDNAKQKLTGFSLFEAQGENASDISDIDKAALTLFSDHLIRESEREMSLDNTDSTTTTGATASTDAENLFSEDEKESEPEPEQENANVTDTDDVLLAHEEEKEDFRARENEQENADVANTDDALLAYAAEMFSEPEKH